MAADRASQKDSSGIALRMTKCSRGQGSAFPEVTAWWHPEKRTAEGTGRNARTPRAFSQRLLSPPPHKEVGDPADSLSVNHQILSIG